MNCHAYIVFACYLLRLPSDIEALFESSADEMRLVSFIKSRLTSFSPHHNMLNMSVYPYFDLYKILDVDEKFGLITMKSFICGYYYVPSVQWDPVNFNNTKSMFFPRYSFWTPDLVPMDAVDTTYESFYSQVIHGYNGMVAAWSSLVTIRFSCTFDVTFFPFDEQHCPITIGQWASDITQYRLNFDPEFGMNGTVPLKHYTENDQWALIQPMRYRIITQEDPHRSYDAIRIDLIIKREVRFYLIIFVVPTVVLYLLSTFVFQLPVESGEKLTLSITTLLAEIVTLDVISSILPASSAHFPILGYFIIVVVIQMSLAIFLSICVLAVHNMGGVHEMPTSLRKFISHKYICLLMLTPCERGLASIPRPHREQNGKPSINPDGGDLSEAVSMIAGNYKLNKSYEQNMAKLWKFLAVVLDRIFFLFYFFATVLTLLRFAFYVPRSLA